ncbi:phage antirepressor N-terminal domain-containing protein [uncultured Thomasclavelia sp.]|uniref:phage antirepressor N-terminal domain-containing protein n=1 Tax=uncultured Thomasclavelia sp. TaxID=3025759 RepID=UPI00280AD5AD|nr:phage antirepressor N-terminal domain-containing protein [uncultured Thomasclavelia sp.]
MNNTNTALQITNFNFYGDELIALKDNATGEIYTAINHILRNIGFTERQVRHNRDKWLKDIIISKGCQNFVIPDEFENNQDTYCISNRKLPIALTKISITPKMKQNQPELVSKLELYQDKCADVLASVFIDKKTTNDINTELLAESITNAMNMALKPIYEKIDKLEENQTKEQSQPSIETTYKKPYNPWFAKMQPKYKLLEEYFDVTRGQLYKNILMEMENLYDVDTQQIQADYCYENNLTSCYPLEPYEFVPKYRDMIEHIVNSNLIKYGIASEDDPITSTKHVTIFDMPIAQEQN